MKSSVSSKGQITIPKALRDRLGIRTGTIVEFREEAGRLIISKSRGQDPIAEVYGQTEDCGPTTMNRPGRIHIGTVGEPLPGVDVRIADDGEVLVRGPNVCAGYWQDTAATAGLLEDGWMHSGDMGQLEAGYLRITGRKKDLIVTSSGKNIAPQDMETRLRAEPFIPWRLDMKRLLSLLWPSRSSGHARP